MFRKLAGFLWETNSYTLQISALLLCYSGGDFASPVWIRSTHSRDRLRTERILSINNRLT